VIGRHDWGLYVATVVVNKSAKHEGEEYLRDQSFFGSSPEAIKQTLLEAAGRVADVQTCKTLQEYVERLETAIRALNATLPARTTNV
jgi:hypothetical protein